MSTFSYNTGVPAANNNPSIDQPEMQTNIASINSLVGIDHVSFNAAGGGRHNQVTFNSNNPASLPANPPVLFTNIQDGNGNNLPNALSQLFYYTGTAAQSQLQYFLNSANTAYGSVMLMGGLILKFGNVTGITQSGTVATFGQPFPTVCFGTVATGTTGTTFVTTISTTTNVTFFVRNGVIGTAFYISVGM